MVLQIIERERERKRERETERDTERAGIVKPFD